MFNKKLSSVFMVVVLSFSLLSCQANPTENIVSGKADGVMESQNAETTASNKTYPIVSVWQETMLNNSDSNDIIINADVDTPKTLKFPVVRIEKKDITTEWAKEIMQKISKENKIYTYADEMFLTKAQIEMSIIEKRRTISELTANAISFDLSDSEKSELIQEFEADIVQLESAYEVAPNDFEETEMPFEFVSSNIGGSSSMRGTTDLGKSNRAEIVIEKASENMGGSVFFTNWDDGAIYPMTLSSDIENLNNITISVEEANNFGKVFLHSLGLQNFEPDLIVSGYIDNQEEYLENNRQCYVIYYTRVFEGINTSFRDNSMDWFLSMNQSDASESEQLYAPFWPQESIKLCITDSGVNYMHWEMPVGSTEIINDNIDILSFSDIQDNFRKQVANDGLRINTDDHEIAKSTIDINRITLGMIQIREKDTYDGLLMIPAWNFYGVETFTYNENVEGGYMLNENNEYVNEMPGYSFLTINAIDGSIINPLLGY